MALAPVVENLDSIPEAARSFYKEVDGKFVIDVDVDAHPQVQGLKKAYQSDHQKVRALTDDLGKYKDVDTERWTKLKDLSDDDLAAIEEARAKKNHAPTTPAHSGGVDLESEIAKRINPMKTAHQRELEARDELLRQAKMREDKLQDDMKRTYIDQALSAACAAESVLPGAIDEVVLYARQFFRINDQGEVIAVDRAGMEIFGTDGKPMKPREWLTSRGPEKNHWFPMSAGGGAGGGRHGNDSHIVSKADFKDVSAKVKYISVHGREAYERLPDK